MIYAYLITGGTAKDRSFCSSELIKQYGALWSFGRREQGNEVLVYFGARDDFETLRTESFEQIKDRVGSKQLSGEVKTLYRARLFNDSVPIEYIRYPKFTSGIIDATDHATIYDMDYQMQVLAYARQLEREETAADNKCRCSIM